MDDKITHKVDGDRFIIEMSSNRFTHDLVSQINTSYPYAEISSFNVIEFNLEQVKMIDSTSIGFLFELHNKLKADSDLGYARLIIAVGNNHELKELLHRFQVDMLLTVK